MTENSAVVIVINGPVASGKSSVARALAQDLEERGLSAACVDLDLVYEMVEQPGRPKDDDSKWMLARRGAAALADAFLAADVAVVIVDGEFFGAEERSALLEQVPTALDPLFVTLRVSLAEASRRAGSDAGRKVSKDPRFLRQHYAPMETAFGALPSTDLVIDTESRIVADIARQIADWALSRRGS